MIILNKEERLDRLVVYFALQFWWPPAATHLNPTADVELLRVNLDSSMASENWSWSMMQIDDVKSCAFDYWYEMFKDVTEKSVMIPLPKDLVKSLLEDRIILPKSARLPEPQSEDSDDDGEVWTDESETPERPEFPEFEAKVSDAIAQLGGCVFPKLNWSAPKDASWLLGDNSLKCRSFTDVYLVLKASDFIAHDLNAPFALCTDFPVENLYDPVEDYRPQLVLRRWKDCRPDSEFRCFVRKKKLIAISQRHHDAYFESALQHKESIEKKLCTFFQKHIHDLFPLSDYAVDLYYEHQSSSRSRVELIDFNVFGQPTDSLLFSWTELEQMSTTEECDMLNHCTVERSANGLGQQCTLVTGSVQFCLTVDL
ncbi:hypothetical protein CRM22_004139 [Opisthorchis felineus]|uniref:Uncharacterized protein n=1 Tax=Opisthorchis felineus TaxID=147828 RepID=A0A4S2LXQ6_OPIFE|nr:hypothetical protein CRM22_004139 [Opisthorchis felineus]